MHNDHMRRHRKKYRYFEYISIFYIKKIMRRIMTIKGPVRVPGRNKKYD